MAFRKHRLWRRAVPVWRVHVGVVARELDESIILINAMSSF